MFDQSYVPQTTCLLERVVPTGQTRPAPASVALRLQKCLSTHFTALTILCGVSFMTFGQFLNRLGMSAFKERVVRAIGHVL